MPQIAQSSELMTNYLQAQVMRPESGMQAVQTENGRALLLSVGTDDALYATIEAPGSRTGWQRHNLSKERITLDFSGRADVKCTSFAVAQAIGFSDGKAAASSIHMAMVIRDGGIDHLYLSLNNSSGYTAWLASPSWISFPYDDPDHSRPVLEIADVYLSEATDATYIVVDVNRDPSSSRRLRFRYYIDPAKPNGQAWQAHDVLIDVEDKGHQSALGRRRSTGRFQVDGIYTAGQVGGVSQLVYAPLYNVFDPENPPKPTLLKLPGGVLPDAIATCRNADNSSDLYVAAAGRLYHFASNNQQDDAACVAVAHGPLFNNVRNLFAFLCDPQTVMVWGLNGGNQIFYTTCKLTELGRKDRWTAALPLLSQVEQVTPFVNHAYSATCFFAHTGENTLTKAVKSPGNLLWSFNNIMLPPPDVNAKARKFDSFTTRILIKNDNGIPLGNTKVKLSTSGALTAVHLNHMYYIVGPNPIEVETDATGAMTLVEAARSLTATQFHIEIGGSKTPVNPMEQPMRKLTALTTADKLKGATIRYQDGSSKKFVPSGVTDSDLKTIASANTTMAQVYDSLATDDAAMRTLAGSAATMAVAKSDCGIIADIGDFFAWLGDRIRQGFEAAIDFIKDVATNAWQAVVRIAGEIYRVAMKAVEDIVEFASWIYNKIKVAVEDVIKYLSFVFDVADMRRTKEVLKQSVKLFLLHQVDSLETIKSDFGEMADSAQKRLEEWAGLPPTLDLGAQGGNSVSQNTSYQHGDSATGTFLTHHFQANAASTTFDSKPAGHSPSLLDPLLALVKKEYAAMEKLAGRVEALAEDITRLSGIELLTKLLGIIAEFGLASFRTIVEALIEVLQVVIKDAVDALDQPLYIPVVSDILESFGIPKFSILDVLCWMAGAATTIIYKLVTNKAPFPDNEHTRAILKVSNYDQLIALFNPPPSSSPAPVNAARSVGAAAVTPDTPVSEVIAEWTEEIKKFARENQRTIHDAAQFGSGLFTIIPGIYLDGLEAVKPAHENPASTWAGVFAAIGGALNGLATMVAPYHTVNDTMFNYLGKGTAGVRVATKLVFAGVAHKFKADAAYLNDMRILGAMIDVVLVIPALATSVQHFVEIDKVPAGGARSIAIVNEVGNLTGFLVRIFRVGAFMAKAPVPKAVAIVGMSVASACTGGLLIADAFIER